jgi:hypothetical protein
LGAAVVDPPAEPPAVPSAAEVVLVFSVPWGGTGCRTIETRKIVVATWWRISALISSKSP